MIKAIAISQNIGMSKKKTRPDTAEPSLFNAGEKTSEGKTLSGFIFF